MPKNRPNPVPIFIIAAVLIVLAACVPSGPRQSTSRPGPPMTDPGPSENGLYIDAHVHLDNISRVGAALNDMKKRDIRKMLMMPTPAPADGYNTFHLEASAAAARTYPDRIGFLGGGGTLNPMIMKAADEPNPGPDVRKRFESRAREILSQGALGFGEMAALHLSLRRGHPFMSVPPDHPLFLLLADIAAEKGVPVDLHMEAVAEDLVLPPQLNQPPNPKTLKPNIPALERLLAHNRRAVIIWDHLGWDNTGHRTPDLTRRLLLKHPNLYMNFKLRKDGPRFNFPMENRRRVKPEWLRLIREFPGRLMIGSDEKYIGPVVNKGKLTSVRQTMALLDALPEDLRWKVGYETARTVFNLAN